MRILTVLASMLMAALAVCQPFALAQDDATRTADEELLAKWRDGTHQVSRRFNRIHELPKAGQFAQVEDIDGDLESYRVASVHLGACIVEVQQLDSNVVVAYELDLEGLVANQVRRAWAGMRGGKPTALEVPKPAGRGGRGGFEHRRAHRIVTTREPFKDFEQGGKRWSGTLVIDKAYLIDAPADATPVSIHRTWHADNCWFDQTLRIEREVPGQPVKSWGLKAALESSQPLLDWSDVALLTEETNRKVRAPLVKAENERLMESAGRFGVGRDDVVALHPGAKAGDWADYGMNRTTLVKLTADRALVELSSTDPDITVIRALEFEIVQGKLGEPVQAFVGYRGEKPEAAALAGKSGGAHELVTTTGQAREINLAGRKWIARDVRQERKPLRKEDSGEVTELLVADDQPFGFPLRRVSYIIGYEEFGSRQELAAIGTAGAAGLNWGDWKPAAAWKVPFTPEQVKAFVKVGMTWKCKQELEDEEGVKRIYLQDYRITKVDDTKYEMECTVTDEAGGKKTVSDTVAWDARNSMIEGVPARGRQRVEQRKLKLENREINVVVYHFTFLGHEKVYALSPDLPGIRIGTEEDLGGQSKVWMTDFQMPK